MVVEKVLPVVARLVAVILPVVANLVTLVLPILARLVPVARRQIRRAVFAGEPILERVAPLVRRPGGELAGPTLTLTQAGKTARPIADAVPDAGADPGPNPGPNTCCRELGNARTIADAGSPPDIGSGRRQLRRPARPASASAAGWKLGRSSSDIGSAAARHLDRATAEV
jgi:hypothetical protein